MKEKRAKSKKANVNLRYDPAWALQIVAMQTGSADLLKALWREHPRILHILTKKNPIKEREDDQ